MSNISSVLQSNTNVRIDGGELSEKTTAAKKVEVKAGSTITGTVVSVSDAEEGKIANINIGTGEISARLSDGMGLREGQTLSFLVRGTSSSSVTISPLYENTSADQSTLKALQAAGIEITNDTVSMVKEMMEAGLSIDRSSLLEMNKNLSLHPNTGISTMVEMKSLNIPINDNNIEQFGNYKNYEHQVLKDMNDIMDMLPETFNELVDKGNTNGAIKLYGEVLKMFAAGANNTEVNTGNVESLNAGTEENAVSSNGILGESIETIAEGSETIEQGSEALNNTNNAQNYETTKNTSENTSEITKNPEDIISMNNANLSATDKQGATTVKNFSQAFLDNLRNLNVSESTIEALTKGSITDNSTDPQKILLKELGTIFENSSLSNPVENAAWKKLFSSDEYNKILKENIKEQWMLKPSDVEKKENIESLYQRLGTQAKAMAEAVNSSSLANSSLGQAANNLSNNLDFMNQLNQMFQYVQLPLQMTGQDVHGDLYVYRNKHKKMSEDGSVSAALHLDMENLGPVDVFVKLLDTKVTTNFYVADDAVLDLINDNIHFLNERLKKRGYTMQVSLKLHDDIDGQDAAVDEMLDVAKTPLLSTTSFDARA